jgi:hypothetical protein
MYNRAWVTFAGFGLALGIGLSTAASSQSADEDDAKATKEAQVALLKLIDTMHKGANVKAEAEAIHKQFEELKPLMNIFKPRDKGGLGVGPKARGDGIELKIISLGKKTLSKGDLDKQQEDLRTIAAVSKAIAEVADLYPPKKDVEKWKKYDDEMRKGADELLEASQSGDPKKVKTAANNLNASCTNCHADFRDN